MADDTIRIVLVDSNNQSGMQQQSPGWFGGPSGNLSGGPAAMARGFMYGGPQGAMRGIMGQALGGMAQGAQGAAAGGAGIGGSAAGAFSGAMAAAGPVGIAIAVAQAVASAVKGAISFAGNTARAAASMNAGQAVDWFEGVVRKIPILGDVIGEAIGQFRALVDAIDQVAKRLAPFSAEISVAEANAEVRRVQNEARRAKQLGPELAAFVDAKSRAKESMENIQAKILEKILPVVTRIMEMIASILEGAEKFGDVYDAIPGMGESVKDMLDVLKGTKTQQDVGNKYLDRINKILEKREEVTADIILDSLLGMIPSETTLQETKQMQRDLRKLQTGGAFGAI